MALVERLMHLDADSIRNIAVHEFFAGITELINGKLTTTQIQTHYAMTAEDIAEWNAIVALIPPANQTAARALFCEHLHAAFILAETRVPTYSTPAEVRARLGI